MGMWSWFVLQGVVGVERLFEKGIGEGVELGVVGVLAIKKGW